MHEDGPETEETALDAFYTEVIVWEGLLLPVSEEDTALSHSADNELSKIAKPATCSDSYPCLEPPTSITIESKARLQSISAFPSRRALNGSCTE